MVERRGQRNLCSAGRTGQENFMKAMGIIFSGAALIALASCGKSDDKVAGANQSAAEVAKEMSKARIDPGEWETTHEILDVKFVNPPEGMPPDIAKSMIGKKTSLKHCVTPKEAENPGADFLGAQKDSKCKFANFSMEDGAIQGTMTCEGENRGSMTTSMSGKFTPTSYDTTVEMTTSGMGKGPMQEMSMQMKARGSGKRLGECPAGAGK